MNNKRRVAISEAYEELKVLISEEREAVDNQEEFFGETEKWQESERILCDAENGLDELESTFQEWGIDV